MPSQIVFLRPQNWSRLKPHSKHYHLGCRKWGFKRWGFKQIRGNLRKKAFFLRFLDLPGALQTLRKRAKKAEKGRKGRFRPKGGQTPLNPQFVTPPFAAAQITAVKRCLWMYVWENWKLRTFRVSAFAASTVMCHSLVFVSWCGVPAKGPEPRKNKSDKKWLKTQRALRDTLMSRGKNWLPTVSRQFLTRNYPRPNCLLKCLQNCLSPTRQGIFCPLSKLPPVDYPQFAVYCLFLSQKLVQVLGPKLVQFCFCLFYPNYSVFWGISKSQVVCRGAQIVFL